MQWLYVPLGLAFFNVLAAAGVVILGLLGLDVLSYAYRRIGVSIGWMAIILAAALAGSLVNLPVARIRGKVRQISAPVTVFGVTYRVPLAIESGRTTIAVNAGVPSCPQRSRPT